MWKTAENSKI